MNKNFKIYGIIFLLVVAVFALLEINKTERIDWRKNFDTSKKSPFGLFIFNKEVNHLLKNKVERTPLSPNDYYKSASKKPHNILIIQKEIDEKSWIQILKNVESGSDALIIAENFNPKISDSLGFWTDYISYSGENTLKLTDNRFKSDSIVSKEFSSEQGFSYLKEEHQILGSLEYGKGNANFIKINHGRGHLYLHTEPLILTNYYLLKNGNEKYVQDVFSYLPNQETIWFSSATESTEKSQSPLRFILSKPALKYAWWLFLVGMLLFVIFNAKRKQRIVPIREPLSNKSVEFVRSIGNLYMQEGDFHDMMAKKAQYFLHHVRTELLIDTQNLDENFAHLLHLKTGKSVEKINKAIDFIRRGQDPYASVMQEELSKMNQLLDEILH